MTCGKVANERYEFPVDTSHCGISSDERVVGLEMQLRPIETDLSHGCLEMVKQKQRFESME